MMFLINNRFLVDPASGNCTDKHTNSTVRLEPRIMQLLSLLAEQPGEVVTRESLVTIIWKDYGGGDEGLTQGISVLRKALSDQDRNIIQTVPKKGYCFNAVVTLWQPERKQVAPVARKTKAFAFLFVLLLTLGIVWIANRKSQKTEVVYPTDLSKQAAAEQNSSNTVTTTDRNGITYRLVMISDRPPVFYRRDTIVPVGQWEPYQEMINFLKTELEKKKK